MLTIDPVKLSKDPQLFAVVRLLAHQLQRQPYMTPGEFLCAISDGDLAVLSAAVEDARDDHAHLPGHDVAALNIMALTAMLVIAEGGSVEDEAAIQEFSGMCCLFICLESMERKGAINLARDRLSFIDSDVIVASARDVPLN